MALREGSGVPHSCGAIWKNGKRIEIVVMSIDLSIGIRSTKNTRSSTLSYFSMLK